MHCLSSSAWFATPTSWGSCFDQAAPNCNIPWGGYVSTFKFHQIHQENVSFTFCTFLCFFYLPQVKKVQFWISSDYFPQEIPFPFYHFFGTFLNFFDFFFQNKIQKTCIFFVLFCTFFMIFTFFLSMASTFSSKQDFLVYFFYFFTKKYQKVQKSWKK